MTETLGITTLKDIYKHHYSDLCLSGMRIVKERERAEDIVQEVIVEYWKLEDKRAIKNIKGYLHKSVYFRAINHLKKEKKHVFSELSPLTDPVETQTAVEKLEYIERKNQIDRAIDELPEKCRLTFVLSRFENKAYKEIAETMGVSVRTVENQISIALKQLRKKILNK